MSQSPNPYNRPLPPEIYRRRRIAAAVIVVVVLVVLVLIVRAVVGGGGSTDSAEATPTEQSTAARSATTGSASTTTTRKTSASSTSTGASATSDPRAEETTVPEGTEEPSETTATATGEGGQCTVDDLKLTVSAGAPTYAGGQQPDFYLEVDNPTGTDCVVDLDESPMSFEVFTLSDYARVWADTDCNEPTLTGELDLAAGEQRTFVLNGWSRTTSAPDQCGDRSPAGTGAFLLYGHLGENISEPETFNLA